MENQLQIWYLLLNFVHYMMKSFLSICKRHIISSGVCAAAAATLYRSHEAQLHNAPQQDLLSDSASQRSLSALKNAKEVPIVGGHAGLLASDGLVYKPLPAGKRGEAELRFYADVFAPDRQDRPPATLMPRFAGLHIEPAAAGDAGRTFLRLEDVTAPFVRPCIMDIKMGVQAWDEDATAAKIAKEACKYPTQQLVGFRLTGMRVWDWTRGIDSHALAPPQPLSSTNGGYREHGRAFGYRLTQSALGTAFREYLFDGTRVRAELLPPFIEKLLAVRGWFAGQGEFRFYGSSLLFVYEGDPAAAAAAASGATAPPAAASTAVAATTTLSPAAAAAATSSASNVSPPAVDVRMIDFAHVFPIAPAPAPAPVDAAASAAVHSTAASAPVSGAGAASSAGSGSALARPITTEERDSGYLLGLDSIIHYMLALLAEHDAVAAAQYQQRWLQQQAVLPRPLMVRGHHFHHVHADGDAAALAFEPGAADAAAAAAAGGATSAAAHVLAKSSALR